MENQSSTTTEPSQRLYGVLRALHELRAAQVSFESCMNGLLEVGMREFKAPQAYLLLQGASALQVLLRRGPGGAPGALGKPFLKDKANLGAHSGEQPPAPESLPLIETELSTGLELEETLWTPIEVSGLRWGLLAFAPAKWCDDLYSDADHEVLRLLAEHAGAVIKQEQLGQELQRTEERYRYFVEQTAEGFYRLESAQPIDINASPEEQADQAYAHMYIAECNDFFAKMYGCQSAEEMIGSRLVDQHKGPNEPENRAALLEFIRSEYRVVDVSTQELMVNGDTVHLSNNAVGIVEDGAWLGIWGTQRDITERKRISAERRALEHRIQASQKLDSLGLLAGGIAHDFNNLLTSILGHAELIRSDPSLPDSSVDYLKLIEQSAVRASELCKRLLDYSGKGSQIRAHFSLRDLIEELSSILRVSIPDAIELDVKLDESPCALEGDSNQLRQVVLNLITNASDAIGQAPGSIEVRAGTSFFRSGRLQQLTLGHPLTEGNYVYLKVSDSGCGLDAETERQMFEPFYSTKAVGRGLGLAAVLGIVRSHGGAIEIQSDPGRGTTISLLFPQGDSSQAPATQPPTQAQRPQGEGLVLIVDDDSGVRRVAAEALRMCGFEAIEAENGLEGLSLFVKHKAELRAALVDIDMPGMTGGELYGAIRMQHLKLPILLWSGYDEQDVASELSDEPHTEFIQKPFGPELLLSKLSLLLSLGHAGGA